MRIDVISGLLVVAILAGAGLGYFADNQVNVRTTTSTSFLTTTATTAITTTITTTQTIVSTDLQGTGCTTPVNSTDFQLPTGLSVNSTLYVLHISIPSEAVVCITYNFLGSGNDTVDQQFSIHQTNGGYACLPSQPCAGLSWAISPSYFTWEGSTNVTVTYRITASTSLTPSIYWLETSACTEVVLAVGPLPTSINPSQAEHAGCYGGGASWFNYYVIGVTNATLASVPVEG